MSRWTCFKHSIQIETKLKSNSVSLFPVYMNIMITFKPFPSSKNSHFQGDEAKCKTFLVKMSLICVRIKIIFISIASHLASL